MSEYDQQHNDDLLKEVRFIRRQESVWQVIAGLLLLMLPIVIFALCYRDDHFNLRIKALEARIDDAEIAKIRATEALNRIKAMEAKK